MAWEEHSLSVLTHYLRIRRDELKGAYSALALCSVLIIKNLQHGALFTSDKLSNTLQINISYHFLLYKPDVAQLLALAF